jgi:hemolysin activation/secretion protein
MRWSVRAVAGASLAMSSVCAAAQPATDDNRPPPVTGSTRPEQAEEAIQSARTVDILRFRIEGNTVLSRDDVERVVYPFLGPQRPVGDVELARIALEEAYRKRGYNTVAVEIPQQDVRGGKVRLDVVELKVGRLRVTGSRYTTISSIKALAPAVAEGVVPNYNEVAQNIASLNTSAERSVTPVLRAGATPGTVDVDLEVDDRFPLSGSLEINDRDAGQTKRLRVAAALRYANLFQANHSLSLQGQFTPEQPDQSWVVSGSYVAPIAGSPLTLVIYGVHSDSAVAAVGGINVIGNGDIVGVRGIVAATHGRTVHQLTLGADYKNFRENLLFGSDSANTPISYVPLVAQYGLNWTGTQSSLSWTTSLNFGVRGLGGDDREFRLKRFNASASWLALRSDLSFIHRFAMGLETRFELRGQLAGGPLISNEQFSAGGLESVRGYFESQELGDDGISGQFDLVSPSLASGIGAPVDLWQFFAFADAAFLRVRDPLADPITGVAKNKSSLASVGLGTRLKFFNRLNASALLAFPLLDQDRVRFDFGSNVRGQFRFWVEF